MELRTSRFLKLFVILLFSLESLGPALFSLQDGATALTSDFVYQQTLVNHGLSISFIAEACDTEERDDNDSNEVMLLNNAFIFSFPPYTHTITTGICLQSQQSRFASAPAIFQLHCSYLI